MYTQTLAIDNFTPGYPLERICVPEETLFIDIETTGFTAQSSYLYMIGCVYIRDGIFYTRQWMAEDYAQEQTILDAFISFAAPYRYVIHFNGNNFDLPYLAAKCEKYGLEFPLSEATGVDIYKRIAPYKAFLKLPNCKQRTIEQYLGINRDDPFTGGELISFYHDYVKNASEFNRNALLLHNREDLIGMLNILPIMAFYDLFGDETRARKVQANYYTDISGNRRQELIIYVNTPVRLPVPLTACADGISFRCDGESVTLRVPIFEGELKYFYANYKDYYYLPTEDIALHKSVSSFVDKEYRVPATAATCYTRKQSMYLPQWNVEFTPFFKADYKSGELFFELTDDLKRDREEFSRYTRHVLISLAAMAE